MSLMSPKNVRLVTSGTFCDATVVSDCPLYLKRTLVSAVGMSDAECHSIATLMRPERFALASFSKSSSVCLAYLIANLAIASSSAALLPQYPAIVAGSPDLACANASAQPQRPQ